MKEGLVGGAPYGIQILVKCGGREAWTCGGIGRSGGRQWDQGESDMIVPKPLPHPYGAAI